MSGLYLNGHSDQFVQARPPKPKRKKNKTMDTATEKSMVQERPSPMKVKKDPKPEIY